MFGFGKSEISAPEVEESPVDKYQKATEELKTEMEEKLRALLKTKIEIGNYDSSPDSQDRIMAVEGRIEQLISDFKARIDQEFPKYK